MAERRRQVAHWIGTYYGGDEGIQAPEEGGSLSDRFGSDDGVRYAIWQVERCPETGRLHYQFYVEFSRSVVLARVRGLLPGCHAEPRRGTREEARDYCCKDDSRVAGPWEYGHFPRSAQGRRSDLLELCAEIKQGVPVAELADQYPGQFIRYDRGIRRWRELVAPDLELRDPLNVIVCLGESGSGKSFWAYSNWPEAFRYWSDDGWWDGYDEQETVVFDDFDGNGIPFRTLLKVLDRYPLFLKVKGASVRMRAKRLVFTTNRVVRGWYPTEDITPLRRRISVFKLFRKEGDQFIVEDDISGDRVIG
jgi:Putative viral replication protein./RNA helicase.